MHCFSKYVPNLVTYLPADRIKGGVNYKTIIQINDTQSEIKKEEMNEQEIISKIASRGPKLRHWYAKRERGKTLKDVYFKRLKANYRYDYHWR